MPGMDIHSGGVWQQMDSQWRCMEGWTLTVWCMEGWTTVEVYGGMDYGGVGEMDTHSGGVWRDGLTVEVYGGMDTHSGGVWRDGHSQWRCMAGMDTHSGGVWRDGHTQWSVWRDGLTVRMEGWTLTVEVYGGMNSQWRCMEGWTLTVEVYGGMDTHSGGVWRDGHTQ